MTAESSICQCLVSSFCQFQWSATCSPVTDTRLTAQSSLSFPYPNPLGLLPFRGAALWRAMHLWLLLIAAAVDLYGTGYAWVYGWLQICCYLPTGPIVYLRLTSPASSPTGLACITALRWPLLIARSLFPLLLRAPFPLPRNARAC